MPRILSAYDDAVEALANFIEVELEASSGNIKGTKELVKKIVKDAYEEHAEWIDQILDDPYEED